MGEIFASTDGCTYTQRSLLFCLPLPWGRGSPRGLNPRAEFSPWLLTGTGMGNYFPRGDGDGKPFPNGEFPVAILTYIMYFLVCSSKCLSN